VAQVVFMGQATVNHVGKGLDASVRVRGKAADIIVGAIRAQFIEHQERIEAAAKVVQALDLDAITVLAGLSGEPAFDATVAALCIVGSTHEKSSAKASGVDGMNC
jgi:hypothetical protein